MKTKGMTGKTHSEKTKAKMQRAARKNLKITLQNFSKGWGWNKGLTKDTDERVKKISIGNKGKVRSQKVKDNLSRKMKERLRDPRNHPRWKGGRKKHGNGYIQIKMPDHPRANPTGYVLEHIVIWEKAHNKSLPRSMSIHHLNGLRDDNRRENLAAIEKRKHSNQTQFKALQKRIRELELQLKYCELTRLRRKMETNSQNSRRILSKSGASAPCSGPKVGSPNDKILYRSQGQHLYSDKEAK